MPSAADRGGNKFLKWRSKKKSFLVAYSADNTDYAWRKLRELLLFTNRNLNQIKRDKQEIDIRDEYRE